MKPDQKIKRVKLLDLWIDNVSLNNIPSILVGLAKKEKENPFLVTYLNAHHFNLAQQDKKYRQILKRADLIYTDGWGIVWAARFFGHRLAGRLTAKDFFEEFCRMAEREKLSLFFLGGKEKMVAKMIKILKKKFPQIKIKGWQNGYFKLEEKTAILSKINQLKPDFLIVGMGSPKQEIWLAKNLSQLKTRVGWCVGGLFDFISGEKPRCPKWFGDWGFEWLFRLLTEPKRLWRRYLVGLPIFWFNVLKLKIFESKD